MSFYSRHRATSIGSVLLELVSSPESSSIAPSKVNLVQSPPMVPGAQESALVLVSAFENRVNTEPFRFSTRGRCTRFSWIEPCQSRLWASCCIDSMRPNLPSRWRSMSGENRRS